MHARLWGLPLLAATAWAAAAAGTWGDDAVESAPAATPAAAVEAPASDASATVEAPTATAEGALPADSTDDKVVTRSSQPQGQPVQPGELPAFVSKGVAWLIAAQHNDGGWGAGSHAAQQIRDPHAVATDPATTSFTLLSLLRSGHTPVSGEYKAQVRRGLEYLITAVEKASANGPLITDVQGTQPQTKLGKFVDTAMTAQYLARALALLPADDPLRERTDKALDVCLAKIQQSQQSNGSWGEGGGWAPVLCSSLACSSLEIASASGKAIDKTVLRRAQDYQKGNYDVASGRADASAAAGVELYAFNGSFRGNATDAAQAEAIVTKAKAEGKLQADAPVSEDSLRTAGVASDSEVTRLSSAAAQNRAQIDRLNDEQLLSGFGNNGGEEFLSYLMTSETLVIAGGDKFAEWQTKMLERLAKIQNNDGSWSGHHCITSPVFCTAAVVQCLTTDRDREFLVTMAQRTAGGGQTQSAASDAVSR
ncbi:MAG: hypothetical protein KDA44_08600 [Planctomycetales bacterium]|nr:hypothetical protein [Planctomycetales bacterium]